MGAMELQIFVSLLVVLGAAFVALICDFLKGNNEKLREFNIELITRQEERERSAESGVQARRGGQSLAVRPPEMAESAQAAAIGATPAQPGSSALAEGIPANPRRRRAGRELESNLGPQMSSAAQPPSPVAAIVAMEDWAKRLVEHGGSSRKAQAPVAPEPPVTGSTLPPLLAVTPAEAGLAPVMSPEAVQAVAAGPKPAHAAASGIEIETGFSDLGSMHTRQRPEAQDAATADLPAAGAEIFETVPVKASIDPVAVEVAPVVALDGANLELPGQAGPSEQDRALPIAELAALETPAAAGSQTAASTAAPVMLEPVTGSPGAGFPGLEHTCQPGEELAPPEARIQSLTDLAKPVDAGRRLVIPEPRPAEPEFGAIASNESGAHLGQAEEVLPMAGAAEFPAALSQPRKVMASQEAAPAVGFAGAEPAVILSAIGTVTLGRARLAGGQPVPVSTVAAEFSCPARVPEPQAAQPELPGAAFSLDSGSRPQAPDWTVEESEQATPVEAEPEPLSSILADEEELEFEAAFDDAQTAMEEPAGPGPDEVVRIRVLDEGDLLQPCGLMDLRVEPMAPAAMPANATLDAGLARWVAGLEDGPEIGKRQADLPPGTSGEVMPFAGFVAGQVHAVHTGVSPLAAVPGPVHLNEPEMALPRVQFGEQLDQDFEFIAYSLPEWPTEIGLEPEQPEALVPPAPPLDFEIEPVADASNRFIEVDNEPEMNAKVVQMPLPVPPAWEQPARVTLRIPRGIHDRAVFEGLAAHDARFDGVVFLVGVMGFEHLIADHGQPAVAQAIEEATSYFDGLLNTDGFGSWIEDSTFVMIMPAASADEARLLSTHTAEGLWDYQLRSLGSLPLIFHWGSAESSNERLGAAVGRAREQMLESGRARKQVLTASGRFRRRVVNG